MAVLRDGEDGAAIPLASRVLVGRASTAGLRLEDKRVSGEHATLLWTGSDWVVRDLGSRNGTFVDGERLEPGGTRSLSAGTRLSFGAQGDRWLLADAGPPGPMARDPEGELKVASGGVLALPDEDQPEVAVYADGRGRWILEVGEDQRPITEGGEVEAGGRTWTLLLPAAIEGTATVDAGPTIDTIEMRFGVSMDEEHVQITLTHQGRPIPLERREHGYVLLTLARQRLEDRALPAAEQGWVDREQLLKWLQLDANGLNVAIYRARGQLADAGVEGAAGVVEVRRGQRRIGLEPERLEVGPLS